MTEGLEDESMLAGRTACRSKSRNLTSVALERGRPSRYVHISSQLILVFGHQALAFAV